MGHDPEHGGHGEHGHSHGQGQSHGHSHGQSHGHGHAHGDGRDHGHETSRAAEEHKSHAPAQVACFVVTCSDSRDQARDESGQTIVDVLEAVGHSIAGRKVVKDVPAEIRAALDEGIASGARAVVFNGGTGIGRRDTTIEALAPLFEKELPGFGELFRYLSFKEIGSPAMMSRAMAGTYKGAIVFALPGSPQAARLALDALILPELGHLVRELSR